jgi:hypothetical protein
MAGISHLVFSAVQDAGPSQNTPLKRINMELLAVITLVESLRQPSRTE